MASGLGFQSLVEVETTFGHSRSSLVLKLSVSDSLSQRDDREPASHEMPLFSASLKGGQHQASVWLSPSNGDNPEWRASLKILVPTCSPLEINMNFWKDSRGRLADRSKVGIWEVIFCGTSTVSFQTSLRSYVK